MVYPHRDGLLRVARNVLVFSMETISVFYGLKQVKLFTLSSKTGEPQKETASTMKRGRIALLVLNHPWPEQKLTLDGEMGLGAPGGKQRPGH